MKKIICAGVFLLLLMGENVPAKPSSDRANDEKAIRAIIAALAEAWTAADSQAWGKSFLEDADFTVGNGLRIKGRDEIARGHAQIFSTIYKDTKLRLDVHSIRFLRNDVAVVHTNGTVVQKSAAFPPSPLVVPVFVMVKDKGLWQIAVFQNTQVQRPPSPASTP